MQLKLRWRFQKGQALLEYVVIAAAVLLAFVSATLLLQQLLSMNMADTMRGMNTPSKLPGQSMQ